MLLGFLKFSKNIIKNIIEALSSLRERESLNNKEALILPSTLN